MSIAVIGSNGFIGGRLVAALRAADNTVVEFPSSRPFLNADGSPADDLGRASTVCYLATRINPAIAERDPGAVTTHITTFRSLLQALARSGKRVIFPSSGGTVYDSDRDPPYTETSPLKPIGRFGATAVAAEQLLAAVPGIEGVTMRISNAYGPGQRTGTGLGVIAHWLGAAAEGEPLHLFGASETTRDFVYVDDVCDAFLRVISSDSPPSLVNIGSGIPTTLGRLSQIVAEVVEPSVGTVELVHDPDRGFDVVRSWLDIGLAKQALGWEPSTELREGLRRTFESNVRHLARQGASA